MWSWYTADSLLRPEDQIEFGYPSDDEAESNDPYDDDVDSNGVCWLVALVTPCGFDSLVNVAEDNPINDYPEESDGFESSMGDFHSKCFL